MCGWADHASRMPEPRSRTKDVLCQRLCTRTRADVSSAEWPSSRVGSRARQQCVFAPSSRTAGAAAQAESFFDRSSQDLLPGCASRVVVCLCGAESEVMLRRVLRRFDAGVDGPIADRIRRRRRRLAVRWLPQDRGVSACGVPWNITRRRRPARSSTHDPERDDHDPGPARPAPGWLTNACGRRRPAAPTPVPCRLVPRSRRRSRSRSPWGSATRDGGQTGGSLRGCASSLPRLAVPWPRSARGSDKTAASRRHRPLLPEPYRGWRKDPPVQTLPSGPFGRRLARQMNARAELAAI